MRDTKKEALFNEVKGSLFEYLVARELTLAGSGELEFQKSLDANYLTVLGQQDRMVRQFYPEMLPFLKSVSTATAAAITRTLGDPPETARLVGKLSLSGGSEFFEADLILEGKGVRRPVSLKLNKKNAFVNTKSAGIKSFFTQYFPTLESSVQDAFNQFVDQEFSRMAFELHALHDLEYPGHFGLWVERGFSELPGELDPDSRLILKSYYTRIAREMHSILTGAEEASPEDVGRALPALLGFGASDILQVIAFHDFPQSFDADVQLHSFRELERELPEARLRAFAETASVEFSIGRWELQIRVKPMNKFTTTAIKINCSVKVRPTA